MKYALYLLILVFVVSCKSNSAETSNDSETDLSQSQVEDVKESEPLKYQLYPFAASVAYHEANILLKGYNNGRFDFQVSGTNYKLGDQTPDAPKKMCANSDQGQHIHLIVDNAPYAAKYEEDFNYDIEDGEHYILAFLSRSYHESIKNPDARVSIKATVKDKTITAKEPIKEPMLFYSRPKGTYVGKANTDKVMLDFYLSNVDLIDGYKIIADINGERHTIERWEPYYIIGLPMGKNTITLTLVDDAGNIVDTPLNPVTREFELKEDPADNI